MDFLSVIAAAALLTLLGLGLRFLRRHRDGETAPEHFFGALDDESLHDNGRAAHERPHR